MIIKSILEKGAGFDRPYEFDEITIDLKIYQVDANGEEKIYQEFKNKSTLMSDTETISLISKKIL